VRDTPARRLTAATLTCVFSRRSRVIASRTRPRAASVLRRRAARAASVVAAVLFVVACGGQVGSAEGGAPDAVEVVLGLAHVQGERVIEEPEPGEGLLQAVDRAGGRLEVRVQVVRGRVVGGSFGEQPPLLALAPPVEQVSAGQHELAAVMAVQVPRTGASLDDGLEGAEPALGRGTAPRQVDRHGLGLCPGKRGGFPREQFPGAGGAGAGDPDLLQDVFQVRLGKMDIVLRHFLGNLAQVTADVGQAGPGAQQAGGQGVAGLVGYLAADVEAVDPVFEALVEPRVGQRMTAVAVAEVRGEQGHRSAFPGGGRPVVPFLEQG
jgi:hypothetical protein